MFHWPMGKNSGNGNGVCRYVRAQTYSEISLSYIEGLIQWSLVVSLIRNKNKSSKSKNRGKRLPTTQDIGRLFPKICDWATQHAEA